MKDADYKKLWRKEQIAHIREHNDLFSRLRAIKDYLESNKILTAAQTKDINKILEG